MHSKNVLIWEPNKLVPDFNLRVRHLVTSIPCGCLMTMQSDAKWHVCMQCVQDMCAGLYARLSKLLWRADPVSGVCLPTDQWSSVSQEIGIASTSQFSRSGCLDTPLIRLSQIEADHGSSGLYAPL